MASDKTSEQLRKLYEGVYAGDKNEHFLKYQGGKVLGDIHVMTLEWLSSQGVAVADVMDFGCGEADFLGHVPPGNSRVGIDYSENALATARKKYPSLRLICGTEEEMQALKGSMDLVTSFGVLEHTDNPRETLAKLVDCAKSGGIIVVSCPSFLNVRGIIFMSLVLLWNVPMSLSDRHYLAMPDFKEMAAEAGCEFVTAFSAEQSVAQGERFGKDMRKRLTNALRDAKMDNSRVEATVSWFEKVLPYFPSNELSGAETAYVLKKR